MNKEEHHEKMDAMKEKLNRALRRLEGLKEKSKLLEMQYEDAKTRESNANELVMELLERQRELNVMLNRANIMLNRTQEAMALTSMEFNEMAKALPEPKKAEWSERVSKVNELFKKTGIQDAEVLGLESPDAAKFSRDEIKKEGDQAFARKETQWQPSIRMEPPRVEAEIVNDADEIEPTPNPDSIDSDRESILDEIIQNGEVTDQPQKKSWWPWLSAKD